MDIPNETTLIATLKEINANRVCNPIMSLSHSACHENGEMSIDHLMYIGLAGDVGTLNYCPDWELEMYFSAVNDSVENEDSRTIWLSYAGELSELPRRFAFPIARVIGVACEYLRTGKRPESMTWQAD